MLINAISTNSTQQRPTNNVKFGRTNYVGFNNPAVLTDFADSFKKGTKVLPTNNPKNQKIMQKVQEMFEKLGELMPAPQKLDKNEFKALSKPKQIIAKAEIKAYKAQQYALGNIFNTYMEAAKPKAKLGYGSSILGTHNFGEGRPA